MNLAIAQSYDGNMYGAYPNGDKPNPLFKITRTVTAETTGNADYTIVIDTNHTSGPAPLAVHFSVLENSTFPGVGNPGTDLSFVWSFDDAGSTYDYFDANHPFGTDANVAIGSNAAHCFNSVGTHTVTVDVYNHANGEWGQGSVVITTSDADTFFAGTDTICFSEAGDFTGAPAGSIQHTDWATAAAASLGAATNKRLLLRGGETYTDLPQYTAGGSASGYKMMGSYGTGFPVVHHQAVNATDTPTYLIRCNTTDTGTKEGIVHGIKFSGDYNPLTGIGDSVLRKLLYVFNNSNWAVCNSDISSLDGAATMAGTGGASQRSGLILINNKIYDWGNYGLYAGRGTHFATVGNYIKQNAAFVRASSDVRASKSYPAMNPIAGTGTSVVHSLVSDNADAFNSGLTAADIVVFNIDAGGVKTLLVDGVGYTSASGTPWTVTATTPVGEQIYIYQKRWPSHGPVRYPDGAHSCISHNDLRSMNSWGNLGRAVQTCIRAGTDGNSSGAYHGGFVSNSNRAEGGTTAIISISTSDAAEQPTIGVSHVAEANYLIADDTTIAGLKGSYGNSVFRSNIIERPDVPDAAGLQNLKYLVTMNDYTPYTGNEANLTTPVDIYNNTVYTKQSDGVDDAWVAMLNQGVTYTALVVADNIIHGPDLNTPLVVFAPIDMTNYGQPQAGSAAINGASPRALVWDDFWGNLRSATTPYDGASEVTVA